MYACMHVCMYAYMYGCMYACLNVCMFACLHACMPVCMYVHVCVCLWYTVSSQHVPARIRFGIPLFHSALLTSNNFQSHGNSRVLHSMRAKDWCICYQTHKVGEVVVIKKSYQIWYQELAVIPPYTLEIYGRTSTASFASRHPHLHAPSWLAWWRPSFSWRSLFDFWRHHQHLYVL